MEVYYNPTTPSLRALFSELDRVIRDYDWQMREGSFLIWFPDRVTASRFHSPVDRQVIAHYGEEIEGNSILIIDTMLEMGLRATYFGGQIEEYRWISQQQAEKRSQTTTHRMVTKQLFDKLPPTHPKREKQKLPAKLPFGPTNVKAVTEYKGDIAPLVAMIALLELFPLTGYYFTSQAYMSDSDSRVDLNREDDLKIYHMPLIGKDHLETLANIWNAYMASEDNFLTKNQLKPDLAKAHQVYLEVMDYLGKRSDTYITKLDPIRKHLANYYPVLHRVTNAIQPLYMDDRGRLYQMGHETLVSAMIATLPEQVIGIILTVPSSLPGQILVGAVLTNQRIVTHFPDAPKLPNMVDEPITSD